MSLKLTKSAIADMMQALEHDKPDTETTALDVANDALHTFVDNQLIYTSNILDLWDGSTHENVLLEEHSDILSAVIASTYFQLMDDLNDAIYDAVDAYIEEHLPGTELNRDDALDAING